MFSVWDFVVGIFAQKAMLNIGWVLSIISCQYLYSKSSISGYGIWACKSLYGFNEFAIEMQSLFAIIQQLLSINRQNIIYKSNHISKSFKIKIKLHKQQ